MRHPRPGHTPSKRRGIPPAYGQPAGPTMPPQQPMYAPPTPQQPYGIGGTANPNKPATLHKAQYGGKVSKEQSNMINSLSEMPSGSFSKKK